jgi:hypothetical protein
MQMNERIRSLLERAEYQAKKQSGYEDWEVYVEPSREQIFEKFAELIIKECARVQHKRFCEHGDVSWDILMEHFGVEE